MKRAPLTIAVAILLGSLSVVPFVGSATAAAKGPKTVTVSVSKSTVTASGGSVTIRATVKSAKTCAWSVSPNVKGFDASVKCAAKLSRIAKLPANTTKRAKRFTFSLGTVNGKIKASGSAVVSEKGKAAKSTPAPLPPTTTTTTTTTTVPPGPLTTFGAGTYVVGTGIVAGTYHALGGTGCYWARLSGFGGTLGEIIANDLASGPTIVTIAASDAGFQSSGCGTWSPLPASGPRSTSFGDGEFAVGIDIASGTYSAPGGSSCYWERDSGFGGTLGETIANDLPTGPVLVTIQSSDVGFKAQGCGTWTHQ